MSLDGRITYISPAVERMRGFTPEEAMNQPLDEIQPPASAAITGAYFVDCQPVPAAALALSAALFFYFDRTTADMQFVSAFPGSRPSECSTSWASTACPSPWSC